MSHDKSPSSSQRFKFQIVGNDLKNINLAVQSVPVAGVSLNNLDVFVKGRNMPIPDNNTNYEPLVVNFVVSEDFAEWVDMYRWLVNSSNNPESYYDISYNAVLTVLDGQNQPVLTFTYYACVITQLDGIEMSYIDNAHVLTSSATLVFSTAKVNVLTTGESIEDL